MLNTALQFNIYEKLTIYSDSWAVIKQKKDTHGFELYNIDTLHVFGLWFEGTIQIDGGDPLGGNINQTQTLIAGCTNADVHNNVFSNAGGYGSFVHGLNSNIRIHDNDFLETMAGCQAGSAYVINFWVTDNYFLGFIPTGGAGTLGSDDMIAIFGNTLGGTVSGEVIFQGNII